MKTHTKLPTFLGLLILVSGLFAGIFLINSQQIFKIGATADSLPKDVRISNITDKSITITWTTDLESTGFVKWGNSQNILSKISVSNGSKKSLVHSETIQNLQSNSDVYFSINSNGKSFENNGLPWQAKTLVSPPISTQNYKGTGTVLSSDSITPASAIVYLTINGQLLSTTTSNEGNWLIPISSYIDNLNENSVIQILVNGGISGTSQATIYPNLIGATPSIVLGKTYDFRSIATSNNQDYKNGDTTPRSSLEVPEFSKLSSRFEISNTNTNPSDTKVELESITEGETINTDTPEFFGKAPSESQIVIQVESELQVDTITADSNGKWNWSPPNNLEPGEHKITLKWEDASGILRTLTRSFVVNASEGVAFESSPSATPKVTTAPTTKPVSTTVATSKSTSKPLPETGGLTPTIGLFIMGMGVLLSSIYIWNKSSVE